LNKRSIYTCTKRTVVDQGKWSKLKKDSQSVFSSIHGTRSTMDARRFGSRWALKMYTMPKLRIEADVSRQWFIQILRKRGDVDGFSQGKKN
jgi:aminoglycoside/choline kinase family phosphotransferase